MQKRIAIAQIDIDIYRPDLNIAKMKEIIQEQREADLIVFPELVVHGHIYSCAPKREILEMIARTPRTMKEDLYAFARDHDTRVIFGEFDLIGDRLYNLAVYVSRDKVEWYAKTHVHWTEGFDAGDELRAFDTPLDRIGILICFDAAFPEAARVLALQGAKIIVIIAAVPRTFDVKYLHRRAASIALDNQVFSVFANRVGVGFAGQSAVFNPQGDCIAVAEEKEEILTTEVNLFEVDIWRMHEAIYAHRRPALYGRIVTDEDPAS